MTTALHPPCVLTIAGSDTGGGAGLQADIKTIGACGAYGLSAITALTAQDPVGVQAVWPTEPDQLQQQLTCALAFGPSAIKVGMLASAAMVRVVHDALPSREQVPLVLDTVMRASSGMPLLDEAGVVALRDTLLCRATVITPNRQEAAALFPEADETEIQQWVRETGTVVLLTGGDSHLAVAGEPRFCTDVLITPNEIEHLTLPRIETGNHHGTGCTLTAALAAFLAHGFALVDAVQCARHFVHRALQGAQSHRWPGNGPLHHFFAFGQAMAEEKTE